MKQDDIVLAIDDERPCIFADTLCRTAEEGIKALQTVKPDVLFLDHDLGEINNGREISGYNVLLFLEEHPEFLPREIYLLTNNGSGRDKMVLALDKMMDRRFGHWERRDAVA